MTEKQDKSRSVRLIENYIRLQVKKCLNESHDPNDHIIQSFSEWLLDHSKSMKLAPRQTSAVIFKFLKSTYRF